VVRISSDLFDGRMIVHTHGHKERGAAARSERIMRNETGDMRETLGKVISKQKLTHGHNRWNDDTAMEKGKWTLQ